MSSTSEPGLPGSPKEAAAVLSKSAPSEREAYIEHTLKSAYVLRSPGFDFDEARYRSLAGRCFDRAFDPIGVGRQMAAAVASGSRRERLGELKVTSLVIHGDADPLIPLAAGEATAAAVPGAELRIVPGMGHDIPEGLWQSLSTWISAHTLANDSL
jgi:pimeloyl-ACP methyl ester carboxylesterase